MLVKLDYDSVATYPAASTVSRPTSPSVTGEELTGRRRPSAAYEGYVDDAGGGVRRRPRGRGAAASSVGQSLRRRLRRRGRHVPANTVDDVLAIDGVVAVQQDELHQPLTDSSPEFIGADSVYDALGTAAMPAAASSTATSTPASGPSTRRSRTWATSAAAAAGPARECNFGDNPLTPGGRPVRLQQQADRRRAVHSTPT